MTIYVEYINGTTKEFNNLDEIFNDNQLNIIKLYNNNNELKELPKEIGNLINLQYFNCYNNQLNELPKEICNLINLQHFNCSGVFIIGFFNFFSLF